MGKYRVVLRKSVARDLRPNPNPALRRIRAAIASLAGEARPAGAEKLSGQDRYRIRMGACRVIYEIHDREVLVIVVKVGHRKDVYRHR
jgi:mRNA interferase RelE/StbE